MKAIDVKPFGFRNGMQQVLALIASDSAPAVLPTTGADIEGMSAGQVFAPMSVLYVVEAAASPKYYVADEDGEFVGQYGESTSGESGFVGVFAHVSEIPASEIGALAVVRYTGDSGTEEDGRLYVFTGSAWQPATGGNSAEIVGRTLKIKEA